MVLAGNGVIVLRRTGKGAGFTILVAGIGPGLYNISKSGEI